MLELTFNKIQILSIFKIMNRWLRIFKIYLRRSSNLLIDTDSEGTIKIIKENTQLRGANFWILFCGAILASIGLDTNSVAIIIGAMLISPLMSPILGIGLSIGINDNQLFISALKNFVLAVLLSLFTAFIYFLITPFGMVTQELLARTTPTLLDVGVAFFGGVAGIVAGSRREKTNAIPGVAIATALMPPLCTAGFGLAKGGTTIFFGAFYLFLLNAFFISLSTFLIVKILQFPQVKVVDKSYAQRVHKFILALIIVFTIPSIFIFYKVVEDAKLNQEISKWVNNYVSGSKREVLKWDIIKTDSVNEIKVYTIGQIILEEEKSTLINRFLVNKSENFNIQFLQVQLSEMEKDQLRGRNIKNDDLITQSLLIQQQNLIDSLNSKLKIKSDSLVISKISMNIKNSYPELTNFTLTKDVGNNSVALIRYNRLSSLRLGNLKTEIDSILKAELEIDSVSILEIK